MTEATQLRDVISANDIETHLFAEFCKEHLCEDAVIFLLEASRFSLLFDPGDMLREGQRIYALYLDEKSEGRIVVSASESKRIDSVLKAADTGEKGTPASVTAISPQLFEKLTEDACSEQS